MDTLFITYDASADNMAATTYCEGFVRFTFADFLADVLAGESSALVLCDYVRSELERSGHEIAERVMFVVADHEGRGQDWVHGRGRPSTKIYFPDLGAEATVYSEVKRGGTASVCSEWDGEAYIGPVERARFTTRKPSGWDRRDDVATLHHIPAGGFAFRITSA